MDELVMRILPLLALVTCLGCANKGAITKYETLDGVNSLYVIGEKFIFTRSFGESEQIRPWIEENSSTMETSESGCLILDPLIIPASLKSRCSGIQVEKSSVHGSSIVLTNCNPPKNDCQELIVDQNGLVIEFQFAPHVPESVAYRYVSGPHLQLAGF